MNKNIYKYAALNAVGTALYVAAVAWFMTSVSQSVGPSKSILVPMAILLLFVFSAALTGTLVLGMPVLWYLDGKKKDAISLFLTTIGMLFIIMIFTFLILALRSMS